MRSEIGTFPRILMEVFVFFFLLFYSSYVNGNTCTRQATGNCTNANVTIDKKSAKEETSFNVYIYRQEKKELVVMLNYENGYVCRKTNGYTCTSLGNDTFNINLGYETLQNVVTLEGDGQQPITCRLEETKSAPPENPDVKPNNRIEDDNGGKMDNPKENGSLVLIIVIPLVTAISAAVVVVVLLRYRKQIVRRWKKNRNEHIDKEKAASEAPLNTESI